MGLQIQVGGGAAQLGAGLGAGLVNEIERKKAQDREDQLLQERRAYEEQVRRDAEAFQAGQGQIQRDFTAEQNQLGRDFTANAREDEQQHDVSRLMLGEQVAISAEDRQNARLDQRDEAERQRRADAARNVGAFSLSAMFSGKLADEGEAPSSRQIAWQSLYDNAKPALDQARGTSEVASILFDLKKAAEEIEQQHDIEDMTSMAAALVEPDESGQAFFSPSEAALLEAVAQSGDVATLKATYAQVFETAKARGDRLAMIEGVGSYTLQIASEFMGSPPADPELAPWHATQSKRLERTLWLHSKFFAGMGENYDPRFGLKAVQDILAEEDPKTVQARAEEARQLELEVENAKLKAQAKYKAMGDRDFTTDEIEKRFGSSGEPDAVAFDSPETVTDAYLEVERLLEIGTPEAERQADRILTQLEAMEQQGQE